MKTNIHFRSYPLNYSYNGKYLEQKYRENQNTYFVFSNFFSKIVLFMR